MTELDLIRQLRPEADADPDVLARARSRLMAHLEQEPVVRVTSPPLGTPQIIPHLPYENGVEAVEWLGRAFGFREIREARHESPGGLHAEMELGAGRIMIGTPGGHGAFPPKGSGNPSQLLSVYVEDVDAHCARARAAGATICAELEDKFYGDRVYEALDLEGHRWSFHQHTGRTFPIGQAPPDEE
jgi:uncharacterized glyoxalase superfamily protein PhnB